MTFPGAIEFRPLVRDDFALLGRWLAEPHVARWWHHDPSPEAVERDFGAAVDGLEPASDFVVLLDGVAVGLLQWCYFTDYEEYVEQMDGVYPVDERTASIDYFVGEPSFVGRGLGTAMIRAFVGRVWASDQRASSLVVPVNRANVASWRALLAAGFRVVAEGDLPPDNPIDGPEHLVLRIDRPPGA